MGTVLCVSVGLHNIKVIVDCQIADPLKRQILVFFLLVLLNEPHVQTLNKNNVVSIVIKIASRFLYALGFVAIVEEH